MRCTRLAANTGRKKVAKNRHLGTIAQLCQAISSQLRHVSTIGKTLLSSDTSSTCHDNMVNFGPLTAEIGSGVWGTPTTLQISTGFASWQHYCTTSSSGRQPNFAALNRGRHLCLAGRPLGWALAHILVNGLFSRTTWVGRHQKGKPIWDFTGGRDDEMAVTSAGSYANHLHLVPDR